MPDLLPDNQIAEQYQQDSKISTDAIFEEPLQDKKPWYKRWWFIAYIIIFVLSVVVLVIFRNTTDEVLNRLPGDDTEVDLIGSSAGQFTTLPGEETPVTTEDSVPVAAELLLTEHSPWLGNPEAPLVIVEFSDFQCPFCRQAYPIIRQFVNAHPEDVMYVYRHFPIETLHPLAARAAEASMCAHEQNLFWPYHDLLFQNQDTLSAAKLSSLAQAVGADSDEFATCMDSQRYAQIVEQDYLTGLQLGVVGTPTFFVNGQSVSGVIPYEIWEEILQIAQEN